MERHVVQRRARWSPDFGHLACFGFRVLGIKGFRVQEGMLGMKGFRVQGTGGSGSNFLEGLLRL